MHISFVLESMCINTIFKSAIKSAVHTRKEFIVLDQNFRSVIHSFVSDAISAFLFLLSLFSNSPAVGPTNLGKTFFQLRAFGCILEAKYFHVVLRRHGGAVVSSAASQQGFQSRPFLCGVCMFSCVRGFSPVSMHSGFLPGSKGMLVR